MASIFDYYSAADLGIEPEYDEPDGRCHGAAYPNAKGCGRFVVDGAYLCPKCQIESDDYWRTERAHEAALDAEWARRQAIELERQSLHADPVSQIDPDLDTEQLPF